RRLVLPQLPIEIDLTTDCRQRAFLRYRQIARFLRDLEQGEAALVADLEAVIEQSLHEAVDRALRVARRHYARDPTANVGRRGAIEQRVRQLSGDAVGDGAQRAHRVPLNLVVRQEHDGVCGQPRIE